MITVFRRKENSQTLLLVGCKKMTDVKCLNLSGTRLQCLPSAIFELVPCLEELDLSNNDIQSLDFQKTSTLVALNCSNNQLKDVMFLRSFPNLEELHVDGNPDLTFSDRYIAACLCPRLKCLDGSSSIQTEELNKEYEDKLWPQVVSVWKDHFEGKCEPVSMNSLQFTELRYAFENKVFESKLYGEDELEKFRNFKVKNMITEIMVAVRKKRPIPSQPQTIILRDHEANNNKKDLCKFKNEAQTLHPSCKQPQAVGILANVPEAPLRSEEQLNVIVQSDDGCVLSDDEERRFRKLSLNVIHSCTPSIEVSENHNVNDGPSLQETTLNVNLDLPHQPISTNAAAVNEILASPRKLQVTLKRLNGNDWVRTSPSPVKSPSKNIHISDTMYDESRKQELAQPRDKSKSKKTPLQRELFHNCSASASTDSTEFNSTQFHDPQNSGLMASQKSDNISSPALRSKIQDNASPSKNNTNSPRRSPRKIPRKVASNVLSLSSSDSSSTSLLDLSSLSPDRQSNDDKSSLDSVVVFRQDHLNVRNNAKQKRSSASSKPHLPSHIYKQVQEAIKSQDEDSTSGQEFSSTSTIQPDDTNKIFKRIKQVTESPNGDTMYSGPTKIRRKDSFTPMSDDPIENKNSRQSSRIFRVETIELSDDDDDDIAHTPTNGADTRVASTNNSGSVKSFNEISSEDCSDQVNDANTKMVTRNRPGSSMSNSSIVVLSPLERRRRSGTSAPPPTNKALEAQTKIKLPPIKQWTPSEFYRCHSINDSDQDDTTHVWQCAFEPDPLRPGKLKHILATCGGRSVCFLDCSTRSVLARYKHFKPDEELFALAWTTLQDENDKHVNILAVAGRCSEIHLIHRQQLICFASLDGKSEFINTLAFHPSCPTYLCSGQADGKVVCWDITPPTLPDYKCECSKLFTVSTNCTVLSIAFTLDGSYTLSGGEGGCFGWPVKTTKNSKNRDPTVEFVHPLSGGEGDEVDSIVVISSEIIASKVATRSCIYLWNLPLTLQEKSRTRKTVMVDIQVVAVLVWSRTPNVCLRMGFCREASLLGCGDSSGQIWLYNVEKIVKSAKPTSVPAYLPSKILSWPATAYNNKKIEASSQITMNKVVFSSDGKYMGAVTDNNLVCIWK